jgi:hypothetical protein
MSSLKYHHLAGVILFTGYYCKKTTPPAGWDAGGGVGVWSGLHMLTSVKAKRYKIEDIFHSLVFDSL